MKDSMKHLETENSFIHMQIMYRLLGDQVEVLPRLRSKPFPAGNQSGTGILAPDASSLGTSGRQRVCWISLRACERRSASSDVSRDPPETLPAKTRQGSVGFKLSTHLRLCRLNLEPCILVQTPIHNKFNRCRVLLLCQTSRAVKAAPSFPSL